MKVTITPFAPKGEITAPPSKSVAMRYILLAAVADGKTIIENVGDSADVHEHIAFGYFGNVLYCGLIVV